MHYKRSRTSYQEPGIKIHLIRIPHQYFSQNTPFLNFHPLLNPSHTQSLNPSPPRTSTHLSQLNILTSISSPWHSRSRRISTINFAGFLALDEVTENEDPDIIEEECSSYSNHADVHTAGETVLVDLFLGFDHVGGVGDVGWSEVVEKRCEGLFG